MVTDAVPEFSAADLLCARAARSIYLNGNGERQLHDLKAYGFERWVYKVRSNSSRKHVVNATGELILWQDQESGGFTSPSANCLRELDSIGDFLDRSLPESTDNFVGGTRLVVQKWPHKVLHWPSTSLAYPTKFISWLTPERKYTDDSGEPQQSQGMLPFGLDTLGHLQDAYYLPPSYPDDLLGDYSVPLRIEEIKCDDGATNLGLVVQSPKYKDTKVFISMALSFDPVRNITSGFLGFVQPGVDENGNEDVSKLGMMDIVLDCLQSDDFSPLITHPVLLPVLALRAMSDVTKGQLEDAREALESVRIEIKRSADRFAHAKEDQRFETQDNYGTARGVLTEKNFDFWGEAFWFNEKLVKNCVKGIQQVRNSLENEPRSKIDGQKKSKRPKGRKRIRVSRKGSIDVFDPPRQDGVTTKRPWLAEIGLKEYLDRLSQMVDAQGGRRDRMTSHLRISFDDLNSVTQFRLQKIDGQHTNHNNNILMALSVISALSLPATVVASIFAMIPFFSTFESDTFQVSSQFKLYWFWTGPITFVIVMTLFHLFGWLKRPLRWLHDSPIHRVPWLRCFGLDRSRGGTGERIEADLESGNTDVEESNGWSHGQLSEKS